MLSSVFGLIIALGILVTVHEYGHFWVARRCGVKVLRFSVGFGHPIWRRTDKHGTEFVIAWIPLGGYVKMLDEREGDVPAEQLDQAFTQKAPWQKIAIALAGPVANFLFAIAAFTVMYMIGTRVLAPIVDQPEENTVALSSGLQKGDRILAVDGEPVKSFSDLGLSLASRVGDTGNIVLSVDRQGSIESISLPVDRWLADEESPNPLGDLGIYPNYPEQSATIGAIDPNGAGQRDGLMTNDVVVAVDGEPTQTWMDWVNVVRAHPNMLMSVTVERNGELLDLNITPDTKQLSDDEEIGYVGVGTIAAEWPAEQLSTVRYWPLQAIGMGLNQTLKTVQLSYQMLFKMASGKVSLKQVGGPISMARMAGASVTSGFEVFIGFLALISISLGIVNLLPVPVLDGGHVVIHTIEWIIRRPLSERMQMISMQIGLAFIISLMCLAFYNDIGRLM